MKVEFLYDILKLSEENWLRSWILTLLRQKGRQQEGTLHFIKTERKRAVAEVSSH